MHLRLEHPRFTKADWERLPDRFPAELVDGFLLKDPTPTNEHQWLASVLLQRLFALVGPYRALGAPSAVVLDELNVYEPDVVVLARPPSPYLRHVGIPLIAIEIL